MSKEGDAEIVQAWRLAQICEVWGPKCGECPHDECQAKQRQGEGYRVWPATRVRYSTDWMPHGTVRLGQ